LRRATGGADRQNAEAQMLEDHATLCALKMK
jgi:hypothetical protein